MNHRTNNFDFLRLFAATLVIVGHHFVLFGRPELVPVVMGKGIHEVGVDIFFVISGFLVSSSWRNDPSFFRFFAKRMLRIFPGLLGVCVFSALILGPMVTTMPLRQYFSSHDTWIYIISNAKLKINYFLPGVFHFNPHPDAVNGSLWSLPAEFAMYILVAVVGLLCTMAIRKRISFIVWGILLLTGVGVKFYLGKIYAGPPLIVWATLVTATVDAGVYFIAGAFFSHFAKEHTFRAVLSVPAIIALATLPASILGWIDPLLLTYVVLAIGMAQTPVIRDAGKFGDFSYGMYLYAFPVQQAVWLVMQAKFGLALPFVFALCIIIALAVLSWKLIEAPCLKWKPSRSIG